MTNAVKRAFRLVLLDRSSTWTPAGGTDPVADNANNLVITSIRNGVNPYIADAPRGDGQSIDLVSGKLTIGSYTVPVIDAVVTPESAVIGSDDFETYFDTSTGNTGPAVSTAWTLTDTTAGGLNTFDCDEIAYSRAQALRMVFSAAPAGLFSAYASRTFTGLPASSPVTVRVRARATTFNGSALHYGLSISGAIDDTVDDSGDWQLLELAATTDGSGTVTVSLGFFDQLNGGPAFIQRLHFDLVQIFAGSYVGEGRVVTRWLADASAGWQNLSIPAYLQQSEDDGATWPRVLQSGFVTGSPLVNGLRYEFAIGDSTRVEQNSQIFRKITPRFNGASCIIGGTVIGGFGADFPDEGPWRGTVKIVTAQYVAIEFPAPFLPFDLRVTASPPATRAQTTPPSFLERLLANTSASTHALPYYADEPSEWRSVGIYGYFPNLEAQITAVTGALAGTGAHTLTPIASPGRVQTSGWSVPRLTTDLLLTGGPNPSIRLDWPASGPAFSTDEHGTRYAVPAQPSVGDTIDVYVYPRLITDRNPLHWIGHIVDFAAAVADELAIDYDTASAAALKSLFGSDRCVRLRIPGPMSGADALEKIAFGPHGFSWRRNNSSGKREFFPTRVEPSAGSVTRLVPADLRSPGNPVWDPNERSTVIGVTLAQQRYTIWTPETQNATRPYDGIAGVAQTVIGDRDDTRVYGTREQTWEFPGQLVDATTVPTEVRDFLARGGGVIIQRFGKGAPEINLALLPLDVDVNVGDVITLDVAHVPVAIAGRTPVTQRVGAMEVIVTKATPLPTGIDLKAIPAVTFETAATVTITPGTPVQVAPTFTLAKGSDPRALTVVTVTNATALADAGEFVAIQYGTGALAPVGDGTDGSQPDQTLGQTTFALPAVCYGSKVWVRLAPANDILGGLGTWTAWSSLQLDALDAPTGVTVTPSPNDATRATVSWTTGANASDALTNIYNGSTPLALELAAGSTSADVTIPVNTSQTIKVEHQGTDACKTKSAQTTTSVTSTQKPKITLLSAAWDSSGATTATAAVDATAATVKFAASTSAYPSAATVRAASPVSVASLQAVSAVLATLTAGQQLYVAAFAYTAGAVESDLAQFVTGAFAAGAGTLAGDVTGPIGSNTLEGTASALNPAFTTLTDAATITWATGGVRVLNAVVTLGGNRTLAFTGLVNGASGFLIVNQDGTGTRTLTLPASSKVAGGGSGTIALSTAAGAIDALWFSYDGTNLYWSLVKNWT